MISTQKTAPKKKGRPPNENKKNYMPTKTVEL